MSKVLNENMGSKNSGPNSNISRRLRDYYQAVQDETIPDKFLDLLERLDQAEQKTTSSRSKSKDK